MSPAPPSISWAPGSHLAPGTTPSLGGVTALPHCDLWAGTVGRKADTFCHFSFPCDCGHKTWEETVGQTAADETRYLMLASATARDLRDTFLTTFCLCKSFKISWAVTEMCKDTSHPKCLKWRKKKKKTGKNENSVKDMMSGMYSNSFQILSFRLGPRLFFWAISSYLKLLAVIADEAVQMGFAGACVRSLLPHCTGATAGTFSSRTTLGRDTRGNVGTEVAMSRDSSGGKSWCSKRGLQTTKGGREEKAIASRSL